MSAAHPHHQPATVRASLFLALLIWLGVSSIAVAAAAAVVFGI